jgi:2-methylcitrate dehydratase PrpD
VVQPLTGEIGRFVAGCRFADLPGEAVANAALGFTDCIGVMLAGAGEPSVRKIAWTCGASGRLPFGAPGLAASSRALIAGAAAHVLDYDDVALHSHTSAVLVPAILALGQTVDASGRDAVVAYAVGFEVWAELIWRDRDRHHNKGWHPTPVFGTVAAAAACAALLRLTADQAAHAVAIAASLAGGLVANFGSMTKSLQVGRAAEAGVMAARLAADGFTGAADAIEHPRGFLQAISPAGRSDVERAPLLGQVWRLATLGLNIKRYPICYCAHRPVDALIDLLAEHPLKPDEISTIDVELGRTAANILRETAPRNALQAKFSLEFAMASAVLAGRVGLRQLQDDFVAEAATQSMMKRVARHLIDDQASGDLPVAAADRVSVTTAAGERIDSHWVAHARGSPALPLTRQALWDKFEECAAPVLGAECRALFNGLVELDAEPSLGGLAERAFGVGERVS